jgi:hypothetical protein
MPYAVREWKSPPSSNAVNMDLRVCKRTRYAVKPTLERRWRQITGRKRTSDCTQCQPTCTWPCGPAAAALTARNPPPPGCFQVGRRTPCEPEMCITVVHEGHTHLAAEVARSNRGHLWHSPTDCKNHTHTYATSAHAPLAICLLRLDWPCTHGCPSPPN